MMSHENRQPNNKNKDLESEGTPECPYLDTVERSLLDFDLERACSVTLSTGNIYACLICGKYFRGRGPQSPAYTHAVSESHYVFVSLDKGSFHCLPDDYVVQDIPDIRAALCPTFSAEQIRRIDFAEPSRDLFGRQYIPGFVGLSNLNKTDGINCVVQALAHVPPLRNYFLSLPSTESVSSVNASASSSTDRKLARQVTESFAGVVRKLWSRDRFKSNVDPHELIHSISVASQKKFGVGRQCEASELMTWLLHQLHIGTGGNHKAGSSIIHETFQGMLRVTTLAKKRRISPPHDEQADDFESGTDDEEKSVERVEGRTFSLPEYSVEESVADSPFLMLTLDLPDKPLFRNEDGGLVIPQEPLATVLKKFDGLTFSDVITKNGASQRKQYQLRRLPDFLILCLSRFKKNDYTRVKNPTIVAFPVKNLDLGQYVQPDASREAIPTREGIEGMKVRLFDRRSSLHQYDMDFVLLTCSMPHRPSS